MMAVESGETQQFVGAARRENDRKVEFSHSELNDVILNRRGSPTRCYNALRGATIHEQVLVEPSVTSRDGWGHSANIDLSYTLDKAWLSFAAGTQCSGAD
jgi:hypothetical protein